MQEESAQNLSRRLRRSTTSSISRRRTSPREPDLLVEGIAEAPTRESVRNRDRIFRRSLIYADIIAALLAISLAIVLLGDDRLRPASALAIPIIVIVSKLMGLYDRDEVLLRKTTLDEAPALFQLATIYTLVAWLLQNVLVDGYLSRFQVLGLWGSLLAFSLIARLTARTLAKRMVESERCLLVGEPEVADPVAAKLREGDGIHAAIVGRLPFESSGDRDTAMRDMKSMIRELDVHRVVLAPREADKDATLDVIRLVKGLGVKVSLLPRVFEVVGSSVLFDDLHGLKVLGIRRFGLSRSSRAVKRCVDLMGATLGLLAVAPFMVAIAIAIRLGTRGRLFFRQVRVGRDGRRFEMLKFRTMVDGADEMKAELRSLNQASGLFKIADDPRVTRVGRFLRKTSLDELPQLINVLKGDMSLVGPRPLVVDEDCKVQGWHRRRLHLTPGMTGHWQILGSSRIPLHEMVKIDYLYVTTWSLWNDMKILLRTVPYVLRGGSM